VYLVLGADAPLFLESIDGEVDVIRETYMHGILDGTIVKGTLQFKPAESLSDSNAWLLCILSDL